MNRTRTKLRLATALAATLACGGAMAAADRLSDTWQEASIMTAYTLNEHLNPFDIDIEVRDGTAYLQGTVESQIDSDLAEQIALGTEGVTRVENNLVVKRDVGRGDASTEPAFARVVNDATVTARVKSQLLWNQNTSGLDVKVSTSNRVVTLAGTVGSETERSLVQQIARNTDGVREVQSELVVGSGGPNVEESAKAAVGAAGQAVSDGWITTKVKSVLLFNRGLDGGSINVDTRDGVVTLSGAVHSDAEGQRAVSLARGVVGVKSVRTAFAAARN